MHNNLLASQINEYEANLNAFDDQKKEQLAKLEVTKNVVGKLKASLPILSERVSALRKMQEKKLGSRQDYLQLKQQQIEQQHDIETNKSQMHQIRAAISTVIQNKKTYTAQQRRNFFEKLTEAKKKIESVKKELEKADQRHSLQRLVAPIDGVVQQLAVHTVGAVVTPAQTLMVLVPKNQQLEVEAYLQNKDIGFVHEGQTAAVKVDAFPFTKYGTLDAELLHISPDAIADDKLGLVYRTQVRLHATKIQVEDKMVSLTPGMSVAVEVKTGKRRIIEYFLNPLLQYQSESIRER